MARATTSDEVKDLRREASALKEVVAELGLENRVLKKHDRGWGRRRTAYIDFLPPGARIAQRVVFGSDYEDGQRVHSSAPSSACARPDRPVRVFQTAVRVLRCPEHVPSPSRTLRKSAGKSNF